MQEEQGPRLVKTKINQEGKRGNQIMQELQIIMIFAANWQE